MSKRDDLLYLGHTLDHARRAYARAMAVSRTQFDADEDVQIVLAHRIQVIGEAATRVSRTTREAHPEVPWPRSPVCATGSFWTTAAERLPDLIAALEHITPPEPPSA